MRYATSASAVAFCGVAAVSGLITARAVAPDDSRQGATQQATSLSPSVEREIERVVTQIDGSRAGLRRKSPRT
jgi:hypothetical protein